MRAMEGMDGFRAVLKSRGRLCFITVDGPKLVCHIILTIKRRR